MERYQSYKISDIEWNPEIPSHWETKRVKNIFSESTEQNWNKHCNFYLSVLKDIGVIPYSEKGNKGNKTSEDTSNYRLVKKGDIVVNSTNVCIGSVGISKYDGCLSSVMYIILRPKPEVCSEYFDYLFRIQTFQKHLRKISNGILEVREYLDKTLFKVEPLPVPSLQEQIQIVKFLDEKTEIIDRLIDLTNKRIELLKENIVTFYEYKDEDFDYFEVDKFWFQMKPKSWEIFKFKDVFENISLKNFPEERLVSVNQIKGVIYRDEQENSVMNPIGDLSNYKLIQPGDFVISLRSSEGGFEYSEIRGLVSPIYTVLRPKFPINHIFYKYLFKSKNFIIELNRYITGIRDGKSIYFDDIKNIPIPISKNINQKILDKHIKITELFKILGKRNHLLKEYKQSLITEVVTGKIKVTTDE
jgi:type I restriction enzyme S subunit